MLWAEVDERPARGIVESIFIEIKKPDAADLERSESMQAGLELVLQLMNFNDGVRERVRFEWPGLEPVLDLFNDPGVYQIFYYARATADTQASQPQTSFLYRGSGEVSLRPFDLISPEDGGIMDFDSEPVLGGVIPGLFRWEESDCIDSPSPCNIRYFFRLWKDKDRSNFILEVGLLNPAFVFFTSDELPTGDFWWDVVAVEQDGGNEIESTGVFKIIIQQSNEADDGYVFGRITDKTTGESLMQGTVVINDGSFNREIIVSKGEYAALVKGNISYKLTAQFEDYLPKTIENVLVLPGNKVRKNLLLEKQEESIPKFNLLVQSEPNEGIEFLGSQGGISNYEISLDAGFDVSVTASPLEVKESRGYIFNSWRIEGEFHSKENVIPPFAIERDTTITAVYSKLGVSLRPGWNLVSVPFSLVPEMTVTDFLNANSDGSTISSRVWWRNEGTFSLAEHFEPGHGYWIRTSNSIHRGVQGIIPDILSREFEQGLHLIGVKGLSLLPKPNNSDITGNIWAWDSENQQYYNVDSDLLPEFKRNKLIPGEAYWIFLKANSIINLGK